MILDFDYIGSSFRAKLSAFTEKRAGSSSSVGGTIHTADGPSFINKFDSRHRTNIKGGQQEHVLIVNIEVVEGIERVAVPSSVSLYRADDQIHDAGAQSSLWFSAIECDYKFRPRFPERPLGMFVNFAPLVAKDVAIENIDCRSQIMGDVPNDDRDVRLIGAHTADQASLPALRVLLDAQKVKLANEDIGDVCVEITDVSVGPFDLYLRLFKHGRLSFTLD